MLSRNQEHELIMKSIYQYLFYERIGEEDAVKTLTEVYELPMNEVPLFSKEVVVKTLLNQKDLDEEITSHLKNWKLERLNLVCHAILLTAIGEARFGQDCSKATAINTAVKLAKTYLDDKDYKFVNAILDNIIE
jgi:N utilization substance protein B